LGAMKKGDWLHGISCSRSAKHSALRVACLFFHNGFRQASLGPHSRPWCWKTITAPAKSLTSPAGSLQVVAAGQRIPSVYSEAGDRAVSGSPWELPRVFVASICWRRGYPAEIIVLVESRAARRFPINQPRGNRRWIRWHKGLRVWGHVLSPAYPLRRIDFSKAAKILANPVDVRFVLNIPGSLVAWFVASVSFARGTLALGRRGEAISRGYFSCELHGQSLDIFLGA